VSRRPLRYWYLRRYLCGPLRYRATRACSPGRYRRARATGQAQFLLVSFHRQSLHRVSPLVQERTRGGGNVGGWERPSCVLVPPAVLCPPPPPPPPRTTVLCPTGAATGTPTGRALGLGQRRTSSAAGTVIRPTITAQSQGAAAEQPPTTYVRSP